MLTILGIFMAVLVSLVVVAISFLAGLTAPVWLPLVLKLIEEGFDGGIRHSLNKWRNEELTQMERTAPVNFKEKEVFLFPKRYQANVQELERVRTLKKCVIATRCTRTTTRTICRRKESWNFCSACGDA